MTLIGFRGINHPQQVAVRGADRGVDDRGTTWEFFRSVEARYGPFSLDAAAAAHNAKCPRYFDLGADGLAQPWAGERVWCNPPYSRIRPWVEKAWAECATAPLIVALLPANRTEQAWWQDLVEPFRDRSGSPLTVEFLPGRLRFMRAGATAIGPNERPPFGCCLLSWEEL